MSQVDVSVVVPVDHTMPYLSRTLESLVEQSIGHPRMQVVAVHDGRGEAADDGSGEELDRYAAAHPGLFTVVHRAGPGGLGSACNAGLDLAVGRYVFFLAGTDHLAPEALERMVEAADAWGSDVLCGRVVGTPERPVSQRLFRRDEKDLRFPDRSLVFALSHTKLFRRSLLTEHGIRHPEDLKVGSDQPFTVAAMLHARRISVLASYVCCHAVRRDDPVEESPSSRWRRLLGDIGAVMDHVADLVEPGPVRDDILVRHFTSELTTLLQRDLPLLDRDEQVALLDGLRELTRRYYTDRVAAGLRVLSRVLFHHVARGDLDALRTLDGVRVADGRVLLDSAGILLCYPGYDEGLVPAETFRARVEAPRGLLVESLLGARLGWADDRLALTLATRMHPRSAPSLRVVIEASENGASRGPYRADPLPAALLEDAGARVRIAEDGTLSWTGEVPAPGWGQRRTWQPRVVADLGDRAFSLPVAVPAPDGAPEPGTGLPAPTRVGRGADAYEVSARTDAEGRVLLDSVSTPSRASAVARALDDRAARLRGAGRRVAQRLGGDARGRDRLARALAEGLEEQAVVAVVTGPAGSDLADRLAGLRPDAELLVAPADDEGLHLRLAMRGGVQLVVDDTGAAAHRSRRFRDLLYHLADGGRLVVRDGAEDLERPARTELAELLADAESKRGEPLPASLRNPGPVFDPYGVASALAGARALPGGHAEYTCRQPRGRALPKLREHETNEWLRSERSGSDRVVLELPAEPFESRCVLHESAGEGATAIPDRYQPPPLALREYHEPVVGIGQLVAARGMLVADTFRHNRQQRLRNLYSEEVARRFARLNEETAAARDAAGDMLPGTYFHLDNEVRGHFGHLMTEQVSKFWAWPEVKERYPDAKAVVSLNKGRRLFGWESQIYAAGAIAPEDVVFLEGPVRVERLLAATPMFSNPDYVHPRITETWRKVGDALAASGTLSDGPRRIFCSRRLSKRSCRNTEEVEALFAAHGFEIVFPEDYTLGDQVRLFRGADVIGGFAGSGVFQICFALEPKKVVLVSSEAYSARNEHLYASLLGHEIYSATSVPENPRQFQSPFTFDTAREGVWLRDVLASLPGR